MDEEIDQIKRKLQKQENTVIEHGGVRHQPFTDISKLEWKSS